MKNVVTSVVYLIGFTIGIAFGGDRVIGGAAGDTFSDDGPAPVFIGAGWPADLNILTDSSDYTSLIDTILGDTSKPGLKSSEAYPITRTRGNNKFSVMYLKKDDRPSAEGYLNGRIDDIILKDYFIDDVDVVLDSEKVIAVEEHEKTDGVPSPIVTLDFHINPGGDRWVGYWNSNRTHPRRSWQDRMNISEQSRSNLMDTLGTSVSFISQLANVTSAYTDAADTAAYVVYVERVANKIILVKNSLQPGVSPANSTLDYAEYTFTGATYINALACTIDKVTGNLVVGYSIYSNGLSDPAVDLKMRVFDSDLNEVVAQRDIANDIQATPVQGDQGPKTKGFELVDLGNNVIGMAYSTYETASSRNVYYQTFNTVSLVVSAPELIFTSALYPSISVDPTQKYITISALKKVSAIVDFFTFGWKNTNPEFVLYEMYPYGAVYELEADKSIDIVGGKIYSGQLSSDRVTFNSIDTDWLPLYYWSTVSNSIDEHKNATFVYNNEYNAKLLVFKDVAIYKDSSKYVSNILRFTNSFDAGIKPFVIHEDSIHLQSVYYGCPSCDADMSLVFEMDTLADFSKSYSVTYIDTTGSVTTGAFFDGDYYRYTIRMQSFFDNKKTPLFDSLALGWNIKPQDPMIDSVRIGLTGTWLPPDSVMNIARRVINRRDTVYIGYTVFDHDNEAGLDLLVRNGGVTIDSISNLSPSTGVYTGILKVSPKNIVDPAYKITLVARDVDGWESTMGKQNNLDSLILDYQNVLPELSLRVKVPLISGIDTLDTLVTQGDAFQINVGDTAWVTFTTFDSNDTELIVQWVDSDNLFKDSSANNPSIATYTFPVLPDLLDTDPKIIIDAVDLIPDTIVISMSDADATTSSYFSLIPNHYPQLDSVISMLPWDLTGATVDEIIDINESPGTLFWDDLTNPNREDPDIDIHPFININIEAIPYDIDVINKDSTTIDWRFLRYDTNFVCCTFDSIFTIQQSTGDTVQRDTTYRGEGLTHVFELSPPDIEITTCDIGGSCISDTLKIKYPRLDTQMAAEGNFSDAKSSLDNIDLVLGTHVTTDTVHMAIFSKGTRDLEVFSVKNMNGIDYSAWLKYEMSWGEQSRPVLERTDSNHLSTPIRLSQGDSLTFDFYWDVTNETGDRILHDTLLIQSNDFYQPLLKIPFTVEFNDLPTISITRVSPSITEVSDILAIDTNTELLIPPFSKLKIVFSEPVTRANIDSYLKVYSLRDSIEFCKPPLSGVVPAVCSNGEIPAASQMTSWASYINSGSFFTADTALDYKGNKLPLYIDTLWFLPYYYLCSISEDLIPSPYNFIGGDDIRIWISNEIRDSVGTRLNIEKDFLKDSVEKHIVYGAKINAAPFQVTSTYPIKVDDFDYIAGEPLNTIGAGEEIRINFNNRITDEYIFGLNPLAQDTFVPVDEDSLRAGTNGTITITTAFNNWQPVDLRYLRRTNNDSSIIFKPRRKFYSKDTVLITVTDSLIDVWGRSLDGDTSGVGAFLLQKQSATCKDTTMGTDEYTFKFVVNPTAFYLFPNPFKFENALHTQKINDAGLPCMEFKNLNSISAKISVEEEIHIRIYNVLGQLVYSSAKADESPTYSSSGGVGDTPSFCWGMQNNAERDVSTGVYLYTIGTDDDGTLKKGKLAVVR